MGRKPRLAHHQQREAIKRRAAGKETFGEIARSYDVSRWKISRLTYEVPPSLELDGVRLEDIPGC